jgi:hypothetical protein
MSRLATLLAALLLVLAEPLAAMAAGEFTTPAVHKQVRKKPVPRGYGFLPGYRPPEVIERQRRLTAWQRGPRFYGPAIPGFYRNRWNSGGLGPCYTYTPIGYIWNCGE